MSITLVFNDRYITDSPGSGILDLQELSRHPWKPGNRNKYYVEIWLIKLNDHEALPGLLTLVWVP